MNFINEMIGKILLKGKAKKIPVEPGSLLSGMEIIENNEIPEGIIAFVDKKGTIISIVRIDSKK